MNILVIMSDEHSYNAMSCSGHDIVKTPNIDCLAAEGAVFTNCYTNSPVCSPARASFFTGLYSNRLGVWDNALSYDGQVKGMSQYLSKTGKTIKSYGKWDFHPNGNYEGLELNIPSMRKNPQYEACFRDTDIKSPGGTRRLNNIGPGNGECYDDEVLKGALDFLRERKNSKEPWILYTGFIHPHFPFHTTKEWWHYYEDRVKDIPETAKGSFQYLPEPLKKLRRFFSGEEVNLETIEKAHIGYYAMTSELDENIGVLIDTLKKLEMDKDTLIIYTSDHGEQLGHHGLWWKCCMYEESAHVPLIIKGPGINPGTVIEKPASLVDIYPTICEALGLPIPEKIDGQALFKLAKGEQEILRRDYAFSEYHGHGMESAAYMIRWRQWKYVYYVSYGVQLFNLATDPEEKEDLAQEAQQCCELKSVMEECRNRLFEVCNPEETDIRAKRDQLRVRQELEEAGYNKNHFNNRSLPEPPRPVSYI